MAVRGRHRRYQPNRINRASLTVTAGGAGLAIPLAAVAGPEIHPGGTTAVSMNTDSVAPRTATTASVRDVRPQTTPQSRAGRAEMYTVVRGDTLSGIADDHDVRGGWHRLYAANRTTVGADPDLILPGQHLSLRTPAAPPARKKAPTGKKSHEQSQGHDQGKGHEQSKSHDQHKSPTGHRTSPHSTKSTGSHALVAPVHAAIGTGYHVAGAHWSKGYHTGIDFLVPTGTSVRAAAAGHVVAAGWGGSYGYQVVIRHADGRYTQYAHLSAISVRAGQRVSAGLRIGRSGATGNVTGPHLHFEVRTGPDFGSDIDPIAYLRAGGVTI
ncbi:peptidoglycan DD-metalloendopeptidase family protein [Streptomyces sp. NPDC048297]|uniref:M23 family metallopeptidase n=1 Tax=Streptomyces sp. NPDC048297 TaxID=3365531 RepID=UPI0037107CE7